MQVGIDAINFYTPNYYLDLKVLAEKRGIDVEKYYVGLGQRKMAIPAPNEDVVTMAANAARRLLSRADKRDIELLLFATESGVDCSKAAGVYVHDLLGLPKRCRVVEMKQACYSGTAAIQLGLAMIRHNPSKKVLVIAADIARYDLESAAESSQGAGAVAMLLSAKPKLLAISSESGFYTEDLMDFWRPHYCDTAIVKGRYSCDVYLRVLEETWQQYTKLSGRNFADHAKFCYHIPVPKLVEKAHKRLARFAGIKDIDQQDLMNMVQESLIYGREVGNCYTASLFIGLVSLLENCNDDLAGKMVGMYSYGSGCVGEYFSVTLQNGYQQYLDSDYHNSMLTNRKSLDYAAYERFYNFAYPRDGGELVLPEHNSGNFKIAKFFEHQREYELVE